MCSGIRWSLPFAFGFFISGLAFGVAAAGVGMGASAATLMSATAFSGTAQLAAVQSWAGQTSVLAILLAALSVNARYLAMGAGLHDKLGPQDAVRLLGIGLLTDAGWIVAMRAAERGTPVWPIYLASAILLWLAWTFGTWIGASFGVEVVGEWRRLAEFFTLALLAASAVGLCGHRTDFAAGAVAAAAAVAMATVIQGGWNILFGGIAGAAYGAWRRG